MRDEVSNTDCMMLEHALLLQERMLRSDGDAEAAQSLGLRASLLRSLLDEDGEVEC